MNKREGISSFLSGAYIVPICQYFFFLGSIADDSCQFLFQTMGCNYALMLFHFLAAQIHEPLDLEIRFPSCSSQIIYIYVQCKFCKATSRIRSTFSGELFVKKLGWLSYHSQIRPAPRRSYGIISKVRFWGLDSYAAVAPNSSALRAVDKTLTENANKKVQTASIPSFTVGFLTTYKEIMAPTKSIAATTMLITPTAFEIRVSGV